MKKNLYLLISIFILSCLFYFCFFQEQEESKNLFFMDTMIQVKIKAPKSKREKAFQEITNIYQEYHKLTDRYQEYENLKNLYYINRHTGTYKIDLKLYELLDLALQYQEKSNHLFQINMGNVIDVWKNYREVGEGIPSEEELKEASIDPSSLTLLGNNEIQNNGANLDLGALAKGYATQKVVEYLKSQKISSYLINAGGNVSVGKKGKSLYKVGIKNSSDSSILSVVNVQDMAVVTSGSYERFYEYEGNLYHHIIDPNTKYPGDKMKSVTILTQDSALADFLSTTLFLMDVEDGKEFLKEFDSVEAIWVTLDDTVIKTEGYAQYE